MPTTPTKSRRGFASMSPEKRREIAAKGGASVPSDKRSFAQNRDLAAAAGRKGGSVSRGGGRQKTAA
jgi:general stress protein YciG